MLTFDDGARDVVTWALPLLEKHNARAPIFVCAQPYRVGRARDGDDQLRHRAASALEPALG
jgi:peptidoglycan/xylan/chitin deacetylase (PgdA/CDA1 family)